MKEKFKIVMQHSVVRNGVWLMVLQGFNTILPFLTIPYVTRILEASSFGDFSLGLNWVGYLQIIVEYGFILSGTKKLAIITAEDNYLEQNKLYSRIVYSRLLLCLITACILILLIIFLNVGFSVKICMCILFLMVVGVVFQHNWFFQGKEDMKYITIGNAFGRTISTILIFIFVNNESDIYLYCFLYSLNFLIMAAFGLILARKKYKIKFVKCSLNEIVMELKDGWYVFISSAMTKVFSGFGVTYLGFFVSTRLIGIYSAIFKIPYLIILVWNPIAQALYPHFSKKYVVSFHEGYYSVKKVFKWTILFFSIIGLIVVLLNNYIVRYLFGIEYSEYSYILIPQVLWVIFGIVNNFLGIQILVSSGHEKEYSTDFLISICLSIFLTILLGYMYTIWGISLALMISEFGLMLLLTFSVKKLIKRDRE